MFPDYVLGWFYGPWLPTRNPTANVQFPDPMREIKDADNRPKKQLHFVRFHISFHQKSVSIWTGYLFINNHGGLSLAKWLILTSHLFGFILFWLFLVWLLWIIDSPIILDLLSISSLIPIIPQRVAVSKTSVDWWPQRVTLPRMSWESSVLGKQWIYSLLLEKNIV